jgi:hypothetical protein
VLVILEAQLVLDELAVRDVEAMPEMLRERLSSA